MSFDPAFENIGMLFTPLAVIWGFCGGWSIDLFLNRSTRSHKDVDVAILRRDQHLIFESLGHHGWTLEQAIKGTLQPFQEDEFGTLPVHTIWCRHASFHPDLLALLLSESNEDPFLFRRDRSIQCPLAEALVISSFGLPLLAPAIVLLYKSNEPSSVGNHLDFQAALPQLNAHQRPWFLHALSTCSPEQEWHAELAGP